MTWISSSVRANTEEGSTLALFMRVRTTAALWA